MNWKSFVNTDNAKRYVLPQGWTSKADIAKELECSEERVRPFLLAAIKDGTIEEKMFVVWDEPCSVALSNAATEQLR